jgi:hypothetical protein
VDDINSEPTVLQWAEMCWFFYPNSGNQIYLGEAGNRSNSDSEIFAMRVGDEVITQSNGHFDPARRLYIFSAHTIVKGFGEKLDGKTLAEIMEEDVVYTYRLLISEPEAA